MPQLILNPHADCPASAVARIEVDVVRPRADCLVLSYTATGRLGEIRVPELAVSERSDELWRHTCFEAFIRGASGPEYYEFNFAPSTRWAAYRFDGYRSGMAVATEIGAPSIVVHSDAGCCKLQVTLP